MTPFLGVSARPRKPPSRFHTGQLRRRRGIGVENIDLQAGDEPAADPREWRSLYPQSRSTFVAEGVYRVTELVGTSTESWEKAAQVAIETASSSLRDLRIAEVVRLDLTVEEGKVARFRTRLDVSFKYESE
jgi:dodecin